MNNNAFGIVEARDSFYTNRFFQVKVWFDGKIPGCMMVQ